VHATCFLAVWKGNAPLESAQNYRNSPTIAKSAGNRRVPILLEWVVVSSTDGILNTGAPARFFRDGRGERDLEKEQV